MSYYVKDGLKKLKMRLQSNGWRAAIIILVSDWVTQALRWLRIVVGFCFRKLSRLVE